MIMSFIICTIHQIRKMIWAGHSSRTEEMRNVYSILVGKIEEKRQIGRARQRWDDNIGMDLREIWWEVVD